MKIKVNSTSIIADLHTPVGLFLKIRQHYHQVLLLESSDYSSKENSLSFICFDSLASFSLDKETLNLKIGGTKETKPLEKIDVVDELVQFMNSFDIAGNELSQKYNGLFGFTSYEAVQHFDQVNLSGNKQRDDVPFIQYDLYKYIIAFDHHYERLSIIENSTNPDSSEIDSILQIISDKNDQAFDFNLEGETSSQLTDEVFMKNVEICKKHCQRGDVFQIVPSRRFSQKFSGDEFNVYRALRSINPSPYLYYYDYGTYKIFGSSPEAQLIIQDGTAEIHPIAGTFKRSGDFDEDMELAAELKKDPKENSEHVMLVDLARNDLARSLRDVKVKEYKTVQFFSHVIHLVSKLTATMKKSIHPYRVFADTFPAGTLSGAPKIKAMEIIDGLEPHHRSYYGGGLGIIFFNGNLNHAIMIRSFLSQNKTLHFQAGAGIVIDSVKEKELEEVNNKLGALHKALQIGSELS